MFKSWFKDKNALTQKKNGWYCLMNTPTQIEVWLYNEIGQGGITVVDFINEVKAQGEDKDLVLHIHSLGGEVVESFAIISYLQNYKYNTISQVEGMAASMSSAIALACKTVKMADNGILFLHNTLSITQGNAKQLRDEADVLDKLSDRLVKIYKNKFTKLDEKKIIELMTCGDNRQAKAWITIEDAREYGLELESLGNPSVTQKYDIKAKYGNVPMSVLDKFDITGKSEFDKVKEELAKVKAEFAEVLKSKSLNKEAISITEDKLAKLEGVEITAKSNSTTAKDILNDFVKAGMTWENAYYKVEKEYPELFSATKRVIR